MRVCSSIYQQDQLNKLLAWQNCTNRRETTEISCERCHALELRETKMTAILSPFGSVQTLPMLGKCPGYTKTDRMPVCCKDRGLQRVVDSRDTMQEQCLQPSLCRAPLKTLWDEGVSHTLLNQDSVLIALWKKNRLHSQSP